ncbi:MAG TPA: YbaK/EbsC family protein [Candidatus Limnocylindrales bacterium]|nr:YbaK/EbsC family protein [Candidatus Limnocylindrales bacterium]
MSVNPAVERARQYLEKFDPKLIPLEHEKTTKTSVEAAQALKVELGQIAKSILFRSGDRYGLFVAAGDIKICDKKVRALLDGGKAKIATPEEVELRTGYQVGGVCPYDIDRSIPIYLDRSMQRFDKVYTSAGSSHSLLPITLEQLQAVTGGIVVVLEKERQL